MGKTLEDVARAGEMQVRMWQVFTAVCRKGVSYMIAIRVNQGLWKGRWALSKGGAKPSSCFLLTGVSVAIDWQFLA